MCVATLTRFLANRNCGSGDLLSIDHVTPRYFMSKGFAIKG